jgi:hypothetical protein
MALLIDGTNLLLIASSMKTCTQTTSLCIRGPRSMGPPIRPIPITTLMVAQPLSKSKLARKNVAFLAD